LTKRTETKQYAYIWESFGCAIAFAFVVQSDEAWDSLTICPWFLKIVAQGKKMGATTTNGALEELINKINLYTPAEGFFKWIFTQLDVSNGFEKVLLHEITHTWAGEYARYLARFD
jgi:hypothetical protein